MYEKVDDNLIKYLPTYKISLIELRSLSDQELDKFSDEQKYLFCAIKYQNDKNKLEKNITNTKYLEKCPTPTAKMFNVMFEMDLQIDESKGICVKQ